VSKKDQGQHRLSRAYLKGFSFRDKDQAIRICVIESGNPITQYKHIKSFTKEVNLFDASLADSGYERYFEEASSKVESYYPRLLKSLLENHELSKLDKRHLVQFVPILFMRQIRTREFFLIKIFEDPEIRKKLFNEISIWHETPDESKRIWELIDTKEAATEQLNLMAGEIWNHLTLVFNQFSFIILEANPGTYWFSSDNPVIVDTRDNIEAWILPPQSEIYFPLSPRFLLLMYNHRVDSTNSLRIYPKDEVSVVTLDEQQKIMWNHIRTNAHRYIIIGDDIGEVDLSTS
jgi:hypothetical protein